MNIELLTVGKTDVKWVKEGLDVYVARLQHYVPFKVTEIPELKKAQALTRDQIKEKEGELILKHLQPADTLILLDEHGIEYRSTEFAGMLEKYMTITDVQSFVTSYTYQRYTVDLSAYAGPEVFLGFHHRSNVGAYAVVIDNITVTNAVWAGTASETARYHVYRSFDGSSYNMIGWADGDAVSYDDNDIQSINCYYKVTAVNTMPGNETCESAPAMAADGLHDYVTVQTDGVNELNAETKVYPNPTHGKITIEAEGMNHVTIMNALGQTVYDAPTDADQTVLDLSQYGPGMYLVRISSEKGINVKRVSVVK